MNMTENKDVFEKTYIKCGQANKMRQIAAVFNKKLNEEFTVEYNDGHYKAYFWTGGIKVHALYYGLWDSVLVGLITGRVKIVNALDR